MNENESLEDRIRKLIPNKLKNTLLALGVGAFILGSSYLGNLAYRNYQNETRRIEHNKYCSEMWKERQRVRENYDLYRQGILKLGSQASQSSLEDDAEKHLVGGDWWYKVDTSGLWYKKFCLGKNVSDP